MQAKRGWEEQLAMMKEKLDLISHECKNKIKEIKEQVEHQVGGNCLMRFSIENGLVQNQVLAFSARGQDLGKDFFLYGPPSNK
jgi:hypothetical protein